jgi:cell division protein FtsL
MAERMTETAPVPASRRMPLLALCLLLAVVVSAIGVVYTAHRSRELFRSLEQARRDQNEIQIEWRQLLLERSTLASHARVEAIADKQLQMKLPASEINMVVIE